MANWLNSDGLYVKFGQSEGTAGAVGEYVQHNNIHYVELTIADMSTLSATAGTILDYTYVIPKNARIEKVTIVNRTAATSGGSATLNIGLIRTDQTTELDYDGLIAACALATFNAAGETADFTPGVTSAGALIGTTLAYNGLLVADYDTAAFTAGKIVVRVYYSIPT
jgi:hypothetical protein